MKRMQTIAIAVTASTLLGATPVADEPDRKRVLRPGAVTVECQDLTSIAITEGTITHAEVVAAGAFVPPGASPGPGVTRTYGGLPAFCRVTATLRPTGDSDIAVEVWMPLSGWHGRYQAVGNGAFTGSIRHNSMAAALADGYATSSTDTGHEGNTARFGLGHPEKVIDFGWRSIHLMAVVAKEVIAGHYDEGPRYSYWNGCSAGGRQAMKLAQRFPEDFDGIVAGAPGQDWTGRAAGALRLARRLEANEAARLSEADRRLVHDAALATCDAADGVEDGVIDSPERCPFDPAVLQCEGAEGGSCLTAAQVETARMMYESPINPRTGRAITGLVPGSELNWTDLGWTRSARATGLEQYRYLVYGDPDWSIDRFDFEVDIVRAEEADSETLNALDPDLTAFFARGGKLLAYHGWSDAQISPLNATQYYERVVDFVGSADEVHDSYRLFMAPGMGHCAGGDGPSVFDKMAPLVAWVERGEAPDRLVATKPGSRGAGEVRRPLCPYPARAVYGGTGDPSSEDNFSCEAGQTAAQATEYRAPRTADGRPDLNGIWQAINTAHWDVEPHAAAPGAVHELGALDAIPPGHGVVDGGSIPYRPEARAQRDANFTDRVRLDPAIKCYLPGVPRATYMPFPFQIIQSEQHVMVVHEYAGAVRTIYMEDHTPAPAPTWMGWSNGSWDGESLVVETSGFNGQTWFDRAGNFHSDALSVTERFTPRSPDTMLYEVTIDDPEVFTRPWTMSMPLYRRVEPNAEVLEFRCVEFVEDLLYGHLRKQPTTER